MSNPEEPHHNPPNQNQNNTPPTKRRKIQLDLETEKKNQQNEKEQKNNETEENKEKGGVKTGYLELAALDISVLRDQKRLPWTEELPYEYVVVPDPDGKGETGVHAKVLNKRSLIYLDEFTNMEICKIWDMEKMLPEAWQIALAAEFVKPYWLKLKEFLFEKDRLGRFIYPPVRQIFVAFEHCPSPDSISAVIIGQDPYHSPGQAHGLAFSVPFGQAIPSSLANIFEELQQDLGKDGFTYPSHGCLTGWAKQGVLLLNTALTVTYRQPGSHATPWHDFTAAVIKLINGTSKRPLVFFAWGQHAQKATEGIDKNHCVLMAAHPSGLSADKGFFGCRHFSAANTFLTTNGQKPISWSTTY